MLRLGGGCFGLRRMCQAQHSYSYCMGSHRFCLSFFLDTDLDPAAVSWVHIYLSVLGRRRAAPNAGATSRASTTLRRSRTSRTPSHWKRSSGPRPRSPRATFSPGAGRGVDSIGWEDEERTIKRTSSRNGWEACVYFVHLIFALSIYTIQA